MKTHLQIATDAFKAVYNLPDLGRSEDDYLGTGNAYLGAVELAEDASLSGLVLSSITWDSDRGNWAWDGALAALEAAGIDVHAPLPAEPLAGGLTFTSGA